MNRHKVIVTFLLVEAGIFIFAIVAEDGWWKLEALLPLALAAFFASIVTRPREPQAPIMPMYRRTWQDTPAAGPFRGCG